MRKILALLLSLAFAFPAEAFPPLGNPIPSVQTATAAGSLILKASAGNLYGLSVTSSNSTAGFVMVFDSATVPADGTVTPRFCYYLSAPNSVADSWLTYPVPFVNGIVVVFSTGSTCYSKTISATGIFISGQVL